MLVLLGLVLPAAAQCPPQWLPGDGLPGVNGTVKAILPLPGGGVIVGGSFTLAGKTAALNIAKWDGAQWTNLGPGFSHADQAPDVRALVMLPNGDLIAGGHFDHAGSVTTRGLARWDGQSWSELGAGVTGYSVNALALLPGGDLLVGGQFSLAGSVAASNVARWNGSSWSPLGVGLTPAAGSTNAAVFAFALEPDGGVIVGGAFQFAGNVSAANVARWNGATWSPLGFGTDSTVFSLTIMSEGQLVAGGAFATVDGGTPSRGLAMWNGSSWLPLVSGTSGGSFGQVYTLVNMPNGDLIAGGDFYYVGGVSAFSLARWNGDSWASVGGGLLRTPYALAVSDDGTLIVGGTKSQGQYPLEDSLQTWNGQVWGQFGRGFNGEIEALVRTPDGGLIAGGNFTYADVPGTRHIAKWNGTTWSPLGGGVNSVVESIAVMPNGDIAAGGSFTSAGGVPTGPIARWNGTSWSGFGGGISASGYTPRVSALIVMPNGDLIAGGYFNLANGITVDNTARWNGTTWAPMNGGNFGFQLRVSAFALRSNGTLFAGTDPAVGLFAWNGSTWQFPSSRIDYLGLYNSIRALLPLPNGDIIAAGTFESAGGIAARNIARWNGTTWSALGAGLGGGSGATVYSLAAAPGGGIFAAGYFTQAGEFAAGNFASWNGTSWSPHGLGANGPIKALSILSSDQLAVGGSFTTVGANPNTNDFAFYSLSGSSPPSVLLDSASRVMCAGSGTSFSVHAIGDGPLTYAWRRSTIPVSVASHPSAATSTLTLSGLAPADAGSYDCLVSNACGSALSSAALLVVLPAFDPSCASSACDPDLNQDGVADQGDVAYLINAIAGGANPNTIDSDFNQDGASDQTDVDALINVVAGGQCP